MQIRLWLPALVIAASLGACVKDRPLPYKGPTTDTTKLAGDTIQAGSLILNEFVAKACPGATPPAMAVQCVPGNYPTSASFNGKWFELHNTTNSTIVLEEGKWFFTDSLGMPSKWRVRSSADTIPAKGYTYICADNLNSFAGGVWHTSFSLSSNGGAIGVFYRKDTTNGNPSSYIKVDALSYPADVNGYNAATRNASYGRANNSRADAYTALATPSPGLAN